MNKKKRTIFKEKSIVFSLFTLLILISACQTHRPQLKGMETTSAAFDESGRLWLAYTEGEHVYVASSDDAVRTISQGVKVNTEPEQILSDGENRPKIVPGPQGVLYVSYSKGLSRKMTGDIRFSRSLDGGKSFYQPVTVNGDRNVTSHRFEALGVTSRGEAWLAWLDKRDLEASKKRGEKFNGASIYYAQYTEQGARMVQETKLADHVCQCCRVSIAIDNDDTPVVVWRHIFGENTRDHALQKLDGKSTLQRATFDDWVLNGCPHHGPSFRIDSDGTYHLAWFSGKEERSGLFYAKSTDEGKSWSKPVPFGGKKGMPKHPSVNSLGSRVALTWYEKLKGTTYVYVQYSNNGGDSWSRAKVAGKTKGHADYPFIISDSKRLYLSWQRKLEGYLLDALP